MSEIKPHPDCRAPHKDPHEYNGPVHACAGPDCPACNNRYGTSSDLNTVRHAENHGIPDLDLHPAT